MTVDETSIGRAWRSDGDGLFWVRFRPSGGHGDAASAFGEAVAAVNEAAELRVSEGPVGIGTGVPVNTSKGPVLFVAFCDSELLERWLDIVAERPERAGWQGKPTAAQPDASLLEPPGDKVEGVTAGLVRRVDHEAGRRAEAGAWLLDGDGLSTTSPLGSS